MARGAAAMAAMAVAAMLLLAVASADDKKYSSWMDPKTLNYKQALEYAFRFYEAQRSGIMPADNRIPWRDDSAIIDKAPDGGDLVGGYYDGSDFRKITHPLSHTLTLVAWSLLEYKDGYKAAVQDKYAEEMLRWGLDYLHKANFKEDELVVQVGNTTAEFEYWGRPEDMMQQRPTYVVNSKKDGADAAAQTVAALAAGSMVFEDTDRDYAMDLRDQAKALYKTLVRDKNGTAFESLPEEEQKWEQYMSNSTYDDKLWAALWLFKNTGDKEYLEDAYEFYEQAREVGAKHLVWNWDNSFWGSLVLMQQMGRSNETMDNMLAGFFGSWLDGNNKYSLYTNKEGFVFYLGGSMNRTNGDSANAAYLALQAAPKIGRNTADSYRCFAQQQVNWLLGDNKREFSYMVGFGNSGWPTRLMHRGASCPEPPTRGMRSNCSRADGKAERANPQVLVGALVSGDGRESTKFVDNRDNWMANTVSLDLNAGLTAALAALMEESNHCNSAQEIEKPDWKNFVPEGEEDADAPAPAEEEPEVSIFISDLTAEMAARAPATAEGPAAGKWDDRDDDEDDDSSIEYAG
jgi:endoglucanase